MTESTPSLTASGVSARRRWMAVLAHATAREIESLLASCPPLPAHTRLRGPESGLVMLRGRAGGAGAPFNLGELAVTRCSVRLVTGGVGHAYVAGRCGRHAELAALVDAALIDPAPADPDCAERILATVIAPLAARQRARRDDTERKAAATRVQFFTLGVMRA